jgi:hypothetical protein
VNLFKCILGKNPCFVAGENIKPIGVMVHSTGANNPMLRRYVQPMAGYAGYDELMKKLGDNPNNNDWNNTNRQVCVHAFVGKLADGSVASVQTLPWDMRGWHSGTGKKGSANNTHISFEICEDNLKDPIYFSSVYKEAVELTAHLCGLYGLNPLADGVVICHSEGYQRGIANNHGDVMHWFPKHGKSMDTFRKDVAALLAKEDDGSDWSKDARNWAVQSGLFVGTGNGFDWTRSVTREELAVILHRYENKK